MDQVSGAHVDSPPTYERDTARQPAELSDAIAGDDDPAIWLRIRGMGGPGADRDRNVRRCHCPPPTRRFYNERIGVLNGPLTPDAGDAVAPQLLCDH